MRLVKLLIPAACVLAWAMPASAGPAGAAKALGATAGAAGAAVVDVQWRPDRDGRYDGRRGPDRRDFRRDHRRGPVYRGHRGPPRGWHRYSRRPGDWRRRGCMQVGPVWFCP
ncbi:hypothetical protein A33M_3234 [Rhodovulum sp. PH10]|uniref:hypothetical protein n=1 Tax=Rhodovulum sp. PH10 TaxID=1187851 RepID=UPI00027C2542|nr:hypothetical protein [Rhodovulum sp. PH10]EJW11338.1 hypothetical protein A33M_3234 [Rhodovulum sp. PH10]